MEFPIRCFTCLKVIGNRYETYRNLLAIPFAKAQEWAFANPCRKAAFEKHVINPRKLKDKNDQGRLRPLEIFKILGYKRYCCHTLFLTYVDIPLPDPDYLERTFPRVKFLNKRSRENLENEKGKSSKTETLDGSKESVKKNFIIAR